MSTLVTQTQSSTKEVEVQNQEKLVPTLHQGTTDEADIKLLSKVFEHKPMIQLTLDGRKAVINDARKSIHVKRHYRNRKAACIKLTIQDDRKKANRINGPNYQLSLKLINKIRFEELMELRDRVLKKKPSYLKVYSWSTIRFVTSRFECQTS
jgi:hypothetical protein